MKEHNFLKPNLQIISFLFTQYVVLEGLDNKLKF